MYEMEVQIHLMYRQTSFCLVKTVTLRRSTKI